MSLQSMKIEEDNFPYMSLFFLNDSFSIKEMLISKQSEW